MPLIPFDSILSLIITHNYGLCTAQKHDISPALQANMLEQPIIQTMGLDNVRKDAHPQVTCYVVFTG